MSEIPLITRLVVKNYRTLLDVDIGLGPLTVFIGKNGAGKSNLIDVLRFVRDLGKSGFESALLGRGGYGSLLSWFANEGEDISIRLYFEGLPFAGEYGLTFGSSDTNPALTVIKHEKLVVQSEPALFLEAVDGLLTRFPDQLDGIPLSASVINQSPRYKRRPFLSELGLASKSLLTVRQFLSSMNFYNIAPATLRPPQKVATAFPLREDGANLSSALRELKLAKRDDYIIEPLSVAVRDLVDYSIEQLGGFMITKLHYTFQHGRKRQVSGDLSQESDGTLRLLSMLTALSQQRFPSPLAIEEPEEAIYPDALAVCGDLFQNAIYSHQLFVTTHSLDLITYLPAKTLFVVTKEDGCTKAGPISKKQFKAIADNIFEPDDLMAQLEQLRVES